MTNTEEIIPADLPSQTEDDGVLYSEQTEELRARGFQQKLFEAIDKGELLKVDDLLKEITSTGSTHGVSLDFKDEDGLNAYSHAINEGFAPVIVILLNYNIPLGDALLRACAVSFEEAVKIIIKHARKLHEKERRNIIECRCDNDDFPRAMTSLKMAAIRNNFVIVQLLLKAGAEKIQGPKLEGLADATLTVVVEYLDIYRALSSPAYLGLAHSNALGNAFKLTRRLRKIAGSWEAVNKDFYDLADQVENFAASLLDHIANTYELETLFRQSDDPEVDHAVSQVQRAVDFDQKAFVAHAYTQKILSITFYRNLDVQTKMFSFLSLFSIFGYPFICLAYLLIQHPRLKAFMSIPHIKLCMSFGSELALFALYATSCFISDLGTLYIIIIVVFVFLVALFWKHVCDIMKYGTEDFLRESMNALEFCIIVLGFALATCTLVVFLAQRYIIRANQRHIERTAMVLNISVTTQSYNFTELDFLRAYISQPWNSPHVVSLAMFGVVLLFTVLRAFNTVLNSFHDLYVIWESTVGAVRDIFTFLVIYVIVALAFSLGLYNLFVPQVRIHESECGETMDCGIPNSDYRSVPISMLTLWWQFNGIGDAAVVDNDVTLVNFLHVATVAINYFVALVLVNTLIAMLGSRFSAVEENSDTEWKFGRTKMWLRLIRSDIIIPPPFNLLPSTGFLIRLVKHCCCLCTGCTKTQEQQSEKPEDKPTNYGNPRRVLKDVLERYLTTKLEKTDEEDSIGIDDLRQLKQDFVTVKYNVQTNLQVVHDMIDAIWATIRNIDINLPTIDLMCLQIPNTTLEVVDTFKLNYPVIDDDVDIIQQAIRDVIGALSYRPEVEEEAIAAEPEVPIEPSPPMILEHDPISEEPRPEVIEEPIAPEADVLLESGPRADLEPDSVPDVLIPLPEKPDSPTVSETTQRSSLTRMMAHMFEAGRTVDIDQEVKEEIKQYRQRFSSDREGT